MELTEGLGIDPKLLLAQIFNFLVLVFLLYKFLYKPVINLLDKRRKMIEESLKTAEKIKQEEETMLEKKREILNRAREETLKIIQGAKIEGEDLKDEIIKKAEEEAKKVLEKTRLQLKEEKEKLYKELKKEIADLVVLATSSVIKRELDEKTKGRLIDQAIEEAERH